MARVFLVLGWSLMLCLITQVSSSPSYRNPSRIFNGIYSDTVTMLMKRVWSSITATSKPAVSSMRFESGYTVKTLFDGTKLGVEPYAVEMLPSGDLLVLDSANSNLYKISSSPSQYNRAKLITGSAEGVAGHVDGKLRDAKFNHPTGIASDEKGNIYIADAYNMVIRKITNTGVTTIAGGKWGRRSGGHKDGPSEDAKFSSDFDLVYVGNSCSLLIVDRGRNKAIREIQLHLHDCTSRNGSDDDLPLGLVILIASCFFGYMLALLQERLSSIISFRRAKVLTTTHQRPTLIPTDDTVKKPEQRSYKNFPHQENFMIRPEDEPPSIDLRTPRKTYPFMNIDSRKTQEIRQHRVLYQSMESDHQQYDYQYRQHHHQKFCNRNVY